MIVLLILLFLYCTTDAPAVATKILVPRFVFILDHLWFTIWALRITSLFHYLCFSVSKKTGDYGTAKRFRYFGTFFTFFLLDDIRKEKELKGTMAKEKVRTEGIPNWMLTPKEEKQVLEEYQLEVWRQCDKYVQEFKKCEALAGFGVFIKCRKESKAMKDCVDYRHQHEFVDEVRDKFIREKMQRQKEMLEQEKKA